MKVLLSRYVLVVLAVLAFAAQSAADENGSKILNAALQKLYDAKSYMADITTSIDKDVMKGRILLMKPNFLRCEVSGPQSVALVADGSMYHMHDRTGGSYMKNPLAAHPSQINGMWGAEIDAFYGGPEIEIGTVTYAGAAKVDGVDCHLVKVVKNDIDSSVYAIGKTDGLIHRAEMIMQNEGSSRPQKAINVLRNVQFNPALTTSDFRFSPPPNAKMTEDDTFRKLLPVGTQAPDFTLKSPDGSTVNLSAALKGRRAVILNFWFYH